MYQEMRTKDDVWMQSIHESIDQLSEILDSMPKDGAALQHDDEDVYKRQVYLLGENKVMVSVKVGIDGNTSRCLRHQEHTCHYGMAVSYTHLDVYKRQFHYR